VEYSDIFRKGTQEWSFIKETLFKASVVEEFDLTRCPHHRPDVNRPSFFGRTLRWRIKTELNLRICSKLSIDALCLARRKVEAVFVSKPQPKRPHSRLIAIDGRYRTYRVVVCKLHAFFKAYNNHRRLNARLRYKNISPAKLLNHTKRMLSGAMLFLRHK
jgi:hypothetical protein